MRQGVVTYMNAAAANDHASGTVASRAMPDRDQAISDAIVQLPPARIQRRTRALTEARALIESRTVPLDEPALRRLLELFNQDMSFGKEVQGRFKTGLVGRNANLLVGSLANVNAIVPQLWRADDAWLAQNLGTLRRSGQLPGGGWLFLSMILHTRDPHRFFPASSTMARGLAALDGGPAIALVTDYLAYCSRTKALLVAHNIDPHGADVLMVHGSRLVGAADDDDDEPQPTSPPAPASSWGFVSLPPSKPPPSAELIHVAVPTPTAATSAPVRGHRDMTLRELLAAPAPPSFGFLHLTDLHQGMSNTGHLWPNVRSLLYADLEWLHDKCGPWHLVFFTGDLTQAGTAKEFDELDRTLEPFFTRLQKLGSTPQLIAVPGNHDLARPTDPFDPVVRALRQWHDDRRLRDHVLGDPNNPYRATLRSTFAAYTDWLARRRWNQTPRNDGLLPGDLAYTFSVGGLDIGVVGLNSAFLQLTGEDFDGKLDVDPRQIHDVCEHDAPDWLRRHHINFLLTHHPPAWLSPRARAEFNAEVDPPGRFAAHLFGHMHDGATISASVGGAVPRLTLQGASLFGLEEFGGHRQRIHGYSAGKVTVHGAEARLRMYPRRMIDSQHVRKIERDLNNYHLDDQGAIEFTVPAARRPR